MISEVTDSAVLLKNIKCMKKYMKIRRDEGGDCFLKWMLHGFLTAAAVCDVRTGRIPNRLIAMMALAGGFYTFLDSGLLSLTLCLGWSAILLAVLFPLFFFQMMGAGDIKAISVLPLFLEKEVCVLTLPSYQQSGGHPATGRCFVCVPETEKRAECSKRQATFTYRLNQEKYLRVFLQDGDVPDENEKNKFVLWGMPILLKTGELKNGRKD